jgi:hypothetical protein
MVSMTEDWFHLALTSVSESYLTLKNHTDSRFLDSVSFWRVEMKDTRILIYDIARNPDKLSEAWRTFAQSLGLYVTPVVPVSNSKVRIFVDIEFKYEEGGILEMSYTNFRTRRLK